MKQAVRAGFFRIAVDDAERQFRLRSLGLTHALTGPPRINIDFENDATGGCVSNALFSGLIDEPPGKPRKRHAYL